MSIISLNSPTTTICVSNKPPHGLSYFYYSQFLIKIPMEVYPIIPKYHFVKIKYKILTIN